ncbi:MAG: ABC transporter permease [Planctomycetaceae bacterium]|nr:ABC transporter permease [Planctomycetaceae bacterium]
MWGFAWQNLITRPSRTALAVVGLTIPILAFLGLFSISRGIRELVGGTLATMQGLMVLRENSPSPVFSDLPADMAKALRGIRGVRVVAPEIWKIAPPIDGRGGLGSAVFGVLTRSRETGLKSMAKMILIEGQDLPEHLKLKSAVFATSILPKERGGGRFLDLRDIGQHNVVISTRIARDYPNADGTPKKVGQTIRIGKEDFTIVGLYETGSLVTDVTIVMEIGVARRLLRVADEAVSTFDVEPLQIADTDALADRIEAAFPEVDAQRVSQFSFTVGAIMGKLDLFLLAAVSLALLVGGVGIANTMLMSATERFVEFGVMRSNGWTRRNILVLIMTESALLGLLSGAVASAVAVAAVLIANRLMAAGFELKLGPWLFAASLAAAVAVAVLSGLYPAWKATTMTPMDAIRRGGIN